MEKGRQCVFVEKPFINAVILLERDEAGGVGGSDTRSTVLNWLVGDGELSQVVTTHLRLDTETEGW